ncbi:hypothetical protein HDU97_006661 [Phlyctochytrium planicorne]|nr:hypothetical protein HDU97_006661 [Phlyctochytrium planicorne]
MNYKRKSVDGLSVGLIVTWFFGDMCNLTGAILTNQLRTQVFVASYFVMVDLVLVFQYIWYVKLRVKLLGLQPREGSERAPLLAPHTGENVDLYGGQAVGVPGKKIKEHTGRNADANTIGDSTMSLDSNEGTLVPSSTSGSSPGSLEELGRSESRESSVDGEGRSVASASSPRSGSVLSTAATAGVTAVMISGLVNTASAFPVSLFINAPTSAFVASTLSSLPFDALAMVPRLCNERLPVGDIAIILGSLAAWCSGLLYFFSRIPQIQENARKRSVEGLSLGLFVFTLGGNFTYGLSILLRSPKMDWAFVRSDLPYVLGSIGVLTFDIVILSQAAYFGELTWENL